MSEVRKAIERAGKHLAKYPNVVGYSCDLQKRIRRGVVVDEDVVRVYVSKKVPREQLKPDEVIPPEIEVEGVKLRTDVVEIGRVKKLSGYRERYRPAPCGVSTSRVDEVSAGTIGWWVFDENGNIYMVSNNHVWAKENAGSPGDQILQPGRADGGDPEKDVIAQLVDFVPISWTGVNKVDVAVAQPVDFKSVYMSVIGVGGVAGKVVSNPGSIVCKKIGRTTGITSGVLFDWSASLIVEYDAGSALFNDVFIVTGERVIDAGDSGSPVITEYNEIIGIAFAGNDKGSVLVGCKSTNIESELSNRMNRRVYTLISNSYPPFAKEIQLQVVYPPPFLTLISSTLVLLTVISVYRLVERGEVRWT